MYYLQHTTHNIQHRSMKITDHITNANGKTLFSFELLPPVKGRSINEIYAAIDPLMEFNPPFIDVTYHREDYIYKKHESGLLEKVSYRKRRARWLSARLLLTVIRLMRFRI